MFINIGCFFNLFIFVMFSSLLKSKALSPLKTGSIVRSLVSKSVHRYSASTGTEVAITAVQSLEFSGDLLIVPFYKPTSTDAKVFVTELKSSVPNFSQELKSIISSVLDENNFKADASVNHVIHLHGKSPKVVALVGLGEKPKTSETEVTSNHKLGQAVTTIANQVKAVNVGVTLPTSYQSTAVSQLLLGLHGATYDDLRFKKIPEGGHPVSTLKTVTFLNADSEVTKSLTQIDTKASFIASGVKFAKDLVGAPANYKTPLAVAEEARKIAVEYGLEFNLLGESACHALGMGGYLGVQQGSKFPPQFVHMVYRPQGVDNSDEVVKVALVGKGLTFDSGGYNLKVGATSSIELMKFDMGGCGAVLGTAKAIGQLKPKNVEVHFITALCENMISAEAVRPGDIVTASNGKTIEVINTDAEGRLTLADALVFAEKLKVDSIVDLATLTGAIVVGLGEEQAGLYSTSNTLSTDLLTAAQRTNEGLWAMPLTESYRRHVKSNIADLKNVGAKGGGSITAALFLSEFVEKTAWAHIDMAGPVWDSTSNKPTGFGVKLLTEYLLSAKKTKKSVVVGDDEVKVTPTPGPF